MSNGLSELKMQEDVKSTVLGVFSGKKSLALLKRSTFEAGEKDPANAQFRKYYGKWPNGKLSAVLSLIRHLEGLGYAVGEVPREKNEELLGIMNRFMAAPVIPSNSTASQPVTQPAQAPVDARPVKVEKALVNRPLRNMGFSYRTRVADELEALAARPSVLEGRVMDELEELLAQDVKQKTLDILAAHDPLPKRANYWDKFLDGVHTSPEVQQVLDKDPLFGSLSRIKDLNDVLQTAVAVDFVLDVQKQVGNIERERPLVEEWAAKRPTQAAFARRAAEGVINSMHRGSSAEVKDLLTIAYMSGYRFLDAHFTGTQTFEGPYSFRRLDLKMEGVASDLKRKFDKLGFIQVGDVQSATYGVKQENQPLLEWAMVECTHPGKGSMRAYNYNNFVNQHVQDMAPLLGMSQHKLEQKGIPSEKFIGDLVQLCKTDARLSAGHSEPHMLVTPPAGMLSILPKEWMEENRLAPQALMTLGITPYVHPNLLIGAAEVRENLPAFMAHASKTRLLDLFIKRQVLDPVIARGVLQTLTSLSKAKEFGLGGKPSDISEILAAAAKNQGPVVGAFLDLNKVEVKKDVARRVVVDARRNWIDRENWMLLDDHIKDMSKDGLSKRTMKMAGAFSVIDEEEKDKIMSRHGRSESKDRTFVGRLLVFPNPLIEHEAHSKTELKSPKYVAPDNSCSPPMLIPVQADVNDFNRGYLEKLNDGKLVARLSKLADLKEAEKDTDLELYRQTLIGVGFNAERASQIASIVYSCSTASKLYEAFNDPNADIEITEGQKKAYKMFQSYQELIQEEDVAFLKSLPLNISVEDVVKLAADRPARANKLFACSPGVWAPAKSWKKFTPEEKETFLEATGASAPARNVSPLNPNCTYALNPSWLYMLPLTGRNVIVTYDQDADVKAPVAHSISSIGQAIKDFDPKAKILYRFIVEKDGKEAKGADDFLVAHGNKPFWDELEIGEVALNVGFNEISNSGAPFLRGLVEKAKIKHAFDTPDLT